jgi:cell fate regulator YaaT (PSP1 superfamily)
MAKEQNLSLNASKITGLCGRLMCCLRYEQNVYDDKMKKLPHPGALVKTEDGEGTVDTVEVIKEIVKVKLKDEEGNNYFKRYNVSDIKVLKDNKKKAMTEEDASEEDMEELKKIEKLDQYENKNRNKDDV